MCENRVRRLESLRSWFLTALAAPAGLSVLSKLDERLDFLPILERIIIGFENVSYSFWYYAGNLINIDISKHHGFLTFYVICFLSILKIDIPKPRKTDFDFRVNRLFELYSSCLILSILFEFESDLGAKFILIYSIFLFILFLIFIFVYKLQRFGRIEGYVMMIFLLILASIFSYISNDGDFVGTILISSYALVVLTMFRITGLDMMIFSRILVFCLGVIAINFSGSWLVPKLEEILESIGA